LQKRPRLEEYRPPKPLERPRDPTKLSGISTGLALALELVRYRQGESRPMLTGNGGRERPPFVKNA